LSALVRDCRRRLDGTRRYRDRWPARARGSADRRPARDVRVRRAARAVFDGRAAAVHCSDDPIADRGVRLPRAVRGPARHRLHLHLDRTRDLRRGRGVARAARFASDGGLEDEARAHIAPCTPTRHDRKDRVWPNREGSRVCATVPLTPSAYLCTIRAFLCIAAPKRRTMSAEIHQPVSRRAAILRILRESTVRNQDELVKELRKQGIDATQSSVSRDLRELGVAKAGDHYIVPADSLAVNHFEAITTFVIDIRAAGPSLTVVKTTTGTAQSVAVAIDKSNWPEVVGSISGDDTIFLATENARDQRKLIDRLREIFRKGIGVRG